MRDDERSIRLAAWLGRRCRIGVAFALLTATSPAYSADCEGTWLVKTDPAPVMAIEIARVAGRLTGVWDRPTHFRNDGDRFFEVSGPVVAEQARSVLVDGDTCKLDFGEDFVFVLQVLSSDFGELSLAAFGGEPAQVSRQAGAVTLGPWDAKVDYVRGDDWPTNSQMTAIFDEDQAARSAGQAIEWAKVSADDRTRRQAVQQLLDSGGLSSGEDFYHAAFVFQHGEEPADYLKAHALALVAVARGQARATWIAAATLDRYLQSIGQAQVYGTQFSNRDGSWTQEPYQRDLLSDALRRASRVPDAAAQELQRQRYAAQSAGQEKHAHQH